MNLTITQAFQSLHSAGFFSIRSGIKLDSLGSITLPTGVKETEWFKIDNNPGRQTEDRVSNKSGTRSFMPASQECCELFAVIAGALKDCGLCNSHHDIELSRGASWVRSKSGPRLNPLTQQTLHFDYDTSAVADRLQLPMSLFVYFQETKLFIVDTEYTFGAGDILLLLGDCPHAGSAWTSATPNFRLFSFLPTKKCTPTWESGYKDEHAWKFYPNTVESLAENLHELTHPQSSLFEIQKYLEHSFCAHLGRFFKFHPYSWYNGLQTICYQGVSFT